MNKTGFIKIINEEISDFDFLGNDEYLKEKEDVDLLKNEDFQKQFIVDSLNNKEKIKVDISDSSISGDWKEDTDTSQVTFKYLTSIEYEYEKDKDPIKFDVNFIGERISINEDGKLDSFSWNDVKVELHTSNGDEIDFKAFKNAPEKIQSLFIREYIESYILDHDINVDVPAMETNIPNIPNN